MNARDRRARRTRASLEEGLLRLMERKSINNITVRELTEYVDINRSTFYLHYTDIYDMVSQIENELIENFYSELERDDTERTTQEGVYHFMEKAIEMLRDNRDKLLILCGENGDHTFIERLAEVVKKQSYEFFASMLGNEANTKNVDLAVAFFCSGTVALLQQWLRSDETMSPKSVLNLMFNLVLYGGHGFVE